MASLRQDPRTSNWLVYFRYGGRHFSRSCETRNEAHAKVIEGRIEETIRLLKQGRLTMPENADAGLWIFSDGKLAAKPQLLNEARNRRLGDICEAYLDDQLAKAETTLNAERIHIRHLRRVLQEHTDLDAITTADLQQYVKVRLKQKHRKRTITGKTIRKELGTFRSIWKWAREGEVVDRTCPLYGRSGDRKWVINIPLDKEKERFQTWAEIASRIQRAGFTSKRHAYEINELWDSLFLDEAQIAELLEFVRRKAVYRFIYPMFVFAAYTGARRSEIRRSLVEDFDFENKQVKIRERKRRKDRAGSFRFVPMHPRLRETMQEWFASHPGGPYTIALPLERRGRSPRRNFQEMTGAEAEYHFKHVLKNSKWSVIRGWHVLRHSFGANTGRSREVSRDTLGEWMGHTTEEMKSLYQHIFVADGPKQIEAALK